MPNSTLFNILWTARFGSKAARVAALVDAIAHLQTLSFPDTGRQLMYRGDHGRGMLHLIAFRFSECEQATSFLSLVIERGRESCGTTALMRLTDAYGATTLHYFAANCSDLSLTKVVLREFPLRLAESYHGSTSEVIVFLRAVTTAYNASNYAALETLCDGSSPYLSRAIHKQAIALRAAVAICLNRQEEAPSAPSSGEASVALSLLRRLRDFGRVGNSSDLLRVVLEFVGP